MQHIVPCHCPTSHSMMFTKSCHALPLQYRLSTHPFPSLSSGLARHQKLGQFTSNHPTNFYGAPQTATSLAVTMCQKDHFTHLLPQRF